MLLCHIHQNIVKFKCQVVGWYSCCVCLCLLSMGDKGRKHQDVFTPNVAMRQNLAGLWSNEGREEEVLHKEQDLLSRAECGTRHTTDRWCSWTVGNHFVAA